MTLRHSKLWIFLPILCVAFTTLACGFSPTAEPVENTATLPAATLEPQASSTSPAIPTSTPTPTPTLPPPGASSPTPEPPESQCAGLSGEIEVRVLVGPSDAVGLEPYAVGSVPFSVTTSEAPYFVQGDGSISYEDTLVKDWGSFQVNMDMQLTVTGECLTAEGGEELHLVLEMSGNQMVEVTAEGFHGEYPWTGTNTFDLVFPLMDGAVVDGEGYSFVLYLHTQ